MEFQRAVPPGPAVSPDSVYTGLALSDQPPNERPHVVANFVSTADGKATAQGRTAQLGGEGDRAVFRLLRTLIHGGLLERASSGVYRNRFGPITARPFRIGFAAQGDSDFCRAVMQSVETAAAREGLLGMAHTPDRSPYELGVKV